MPTDDRITRIGGRLAIAVAAMLGVACSAFRSRFASHEDVFPPVALTIGDVRVIGTDTAYVVSGRGYELLAPSRELLPDARQALDGAERAYRRYLSADPARVVVDLRPRTDSASRAGRSPGASDTVVVHIPKVRRERGPQGAVPINRGRFVVAPVVRAWLAAYAAGATRGAGVAETAGVTTVERWGHDPRVPDWIETALPALVSEAPVADFAAAQLARQPSELIPLRALFDSTQAQHPEGVSGGDDPSRAPAGAVAAGSPGEREPPRRMRRGDGKVGRAMIFPLESIAVTQFLIDRAGQAFVGEVTGRTLRGERMDDILRTATGLPKTVEGLDAAWRAWLTEQGRGGRRGGPGH